MVTLSVAKFADLFSKAEGQTEAVIECAINHGVVRKLRLDGEVVVLDALSGPVVRVSVEEPIVYEAWCFDRGSLLFNAREIGLPDAKLATEYDVLRYPDGSQFALVPKSHEQED